MDRLSETSCNISHSCEHIEPNYDDIIELYLDTHDNQVGFKKQHSTDMCIFTLKSVIKYYTRQSTPVFSMVSHRGHNCISSALTILDSALTS